MIFQNNVLKEALKNVYFITGTPCGSKTTISRALAKRHGFLVYDADEHFARHQRLSDAVSQPAMNKIFPDANAFFGRTVAEYRQWLLDNTREQLDFVLLDLIRLSQEQIVLCDCHLTLEQAAQLTDATRIAFLIKDPTHIIDDYCDRPDHQDFSAFINSASDPEKARAVCNETLRSLNEPYYHAIRESGYFRFERTADSTVDDTVRQVEAHFGFGTARMEHRDTASVSR